MINLRSALRQQEDLRKPNIDEMESRLWVVEARVKRALAEIDIICVRDLGK